MLRDGRRDRAAVEPRRGPRLESRRPLARGDRRGRHRSGAGAPARRPPRCCGGAGAELSRRPGPPSRSPPRARASRRSGPRRRGAPGALPVATTCRGSPRIWRPAGLRAADALPARRSASRTGPRRAADSAAACARRARPSRSPPPWPTVRDAMVALDAGDPLAAVERALRVGDRRRDERRGRSRRRVSRMLAGRALAAAGETEARRRRAGARAAADFDALRRRSRRRRGRRARAAASSAAALHRRTRPGKADGTGVESLTERELAGGAAGRRSQDERRRSPSELFLSPKTVETPHPPPLPASSTCRRGWRSRAWSSAPTAKSARGSAPALDQGAVSNQGP